MSQTKTVGGYFLSYGILCRIVERNIRSFAATVSLFCQRLFGIFWKERTETVVFIPLHVLKVSQTEAFYKD